jgi:DUF4097 and DUF4098 domain-containing protein YvlB
MPIFDSPDPISVTLELVVGDARIIASDRTDTVVEVRPTDESKDLDRKVADQTRVEFTNGKLLVKAPRQRAIFGKPGSIDVVIELPAGSQVHGRSAMSALRAEGRLGDCKFKTALGDIAIDQAGSLDLNSAVGDITVERAAGHADVTTGSGALRLGAIDGPAVVKNSNGATAISEVTGDLRVNAANGDITIGLAHADVDAKTANGSIRVGEVVRGSVELKTALGELEIGIREGTAAWLDVSSTAGSLRNSLNAADGPDQAKETVEVHARTSLGDIVIRRA